MSEDGDADPLLEELQAPWNAVEEGIDHEDMTMKELFQKSPNSLLRALQIKGVTKVGEFTAPDTLVLEAFDGGDIITMGSNRRHIDVQRQWMQQLTARSSPDNNQAPPVGWHTDLYLEAFVVNIVHVADPDENGIIHPLLQRWQIGAVSLAVFGIPSVQAVISFKWDSFAKKMLMGELACFMVWLLGFFGFTWLFQDEDLTLRFTQLLITPRGLATVALELVALVGMAPLAALEPATLKAYGWKGWFNVWNGLDLTTYILQVAITVMHITRTGLVSPWLSVAAAMQCICLLFRLQFFSRVFKSTRFSFLEAIRDVISEIRYYFAFLLIILSGFAAAFHILFRQDQNSHGKEPGPFATLPSSFLYLFTHPDAVEMDPMLEASLPKAAVSLALIYQFTMGMVLVNLLISIMTDTLEKVNRHEGLKLQLHKVQIIDELELTIPKWLQDRFPEWFPKYVHVLRVDQERKDKVDLGQIWRAGNGGNRNSNLGGGGDDEGGGGGGGGGSNGEEIHKQLKSMQIQLDRLEQLLMMDKIRIRGSGDSGSGAIPVVGS
jgi:uncharacterized membrane protein YgcG